MNVVAVIQARMGSTRLPGKVLKDLCGDTVLARTVCRARRAVLLTDVVIATTTNAADDAIVLESQRLKCSVFRGSEQDVLDRYYCAAKESKADVVVRITSDCPLIDPEVSDKTIRAFLNGDADYASNVLERTYPRGLDTEVMSFSCVSEHAWSEASRTFSTRARYPFSAPEPGAFQAALGHR